MTKAGEYDNYKDFNENLKKIYNNVAESDIESTAEGSVLYFVKRKKDNTGTTRVLSLCKLKT